VLRLRQGRARVRSDGAWRGWLASGASLVLLVCSITAGSAQVRRPTGRPAAPAATRHPQFKAVFEPVNFSADAAFTDVAFVDPLTGWACGHAAADPDHGGFIAATRDGGRTWTLQVGDPRSPSLPVERLFAFDGTHGWAQLSDGSIVRTTDGRAWQPIRGPGAFGPLVFLSPLRGVLGNRGQGIHLTADGGVTWTQAYRCPLPGCRVVAIAFAPDGATGYALARLESGAGSLLLKTANAGETWTSAGGMLADTGRGDASLAVLDAQSAYLLDEGALSATEDGGLTWHDVAAPLAPRAARLAFARDVAWIVAGREFVYTLDAGRRWNLRRLEFPSDVVAFSLPSPDVGYVVGAGGMVYRYGVVPFAYTVPQMLVVPALSASGPGGS
jgi:photosystem II stability/assembly factor-like uncharacterized protein